MLSLVEGLRPVRAQLQIVNRLLTTVFDQVIVPQPYTIITLRAMNISLLATCPVNLSSDQGRARS